MSSGPVRIPEDKIYKCRQCGKMFVSAERLDTHCRTHNSHDGSRHWHVCQKCGELFRTFSELHEHRLTDHGKQELEGQSFECRNCKKLFSSLRNLRDHEQTHSGGKQFACEDCGMKFTKRNNLKTHRKRLHHKRD